MDFDFPHGVILLWSGSTVIMSRQALQMLTPVTRQQSASWRRAFARASFGSWAAKVEYWQAFPDRRARSLKRANVGLGSKPGCPPMPPTIVAVAALPVTYGILATMSGRFFSSQAMASGPSTTHSKVSQVGSSRDSDCSRFAAYSTRSCKRSYPRRRSRESAIAVLAHPRWAKSIMLGASASLNQGVASNSMQRTLSAVWQVAWIIGFFRSPANNLR
jgi:hypothetical protein